MESRRREIGSPRLEAAVLPSGVRWKRRKSVGTSEYELEDPMFRGSCNSQYFESLDPSQQRVVSADLLTNSIFRVDEDEYDPLLVGFATLREAVARTIRRRGLSLAQNHRASGTRSFEEATHQASALAEHAALILLGSLAQRTSSPPELQEVINALCFRFENAFLAAYIFNRYGVGRGTWSEADISRWPHQELSHDLSVDAYSEFSSYRLHPDRTLRKLADGDVTVLASSTGWSSVRSFFYDAMPEFITLVPVTLLPPEQQHKAIPELRAILEALGRLSIITLKTPVLRNMASERSREYERELAELFSTYVRRSSAEPSAARPEAPPYGVSARGAEKLCKEWMVFLGVEDAMVTSYTQDGGIDITSEKFVAQVKHYAGSVGAPEVQQLVGVAYTSKKLPLFFCSGTYTPAAIAAAEAVEMPLLTYSAEEGTLRGANRFGASVVRDGLA